MGRFLLWIIFLHAVFFLSCRKDDMMPEKPRKISFANPAEGQISRYILLKGENYNSPSNASFQYIADTLIVEITEATSEGYEVKEYLSPGSASLNGENNVSFADSTIYYYLSIDEESLTIKNVHFRMNSRLFFMQSPLQESLSMKKQEVLKVEMKSWKTNLPYATDYFEAYVENYEQLGVMYDRLSVVVDNRGLKNGGSGHMHVYSAEAGLVRSTQYNASNFKGFGWDLLP